MIPLGIIFSSLSVPCLVERRIPVLCSMNFTTFYRVISIIFYVVNIITVPWTL